MVLAHFFTGVPSPLYSTVFFSYLNLLLMNSSLSEKSACGVGFIASRKNQFSHENLQQALHALSCVEHRGACGADMVSSDGAGIMADIPFEMFGYKQGEVAVATIFAPHSSHRRRKALRVFEETFNFYGLKVLDYRIVPINPDVLGRDAHESMPYILHAFIERPDHCRTDSSFDKLLYTAKQMTRTREKAHGIVKEFFFASLSARTIVYKALTKANVLKEFYLDLKDPRFKTRFALFHRRFSTNTRTSWDKTQPFRIIAHNGEINTITGNRSWAISREKYLGVREDELLTRQQISDSGSLNEMVESLNYRSSIPFVEDILAIMIPPATEDNSFYKFWSRAMEPWDGPAFISYSDGSSIGGRLDRNGFRPCRWMITDDHLYVGSEAGSFNVDQRLITAKGSLQAGNGIKMDLQIGKVHFRDPSFSRENFDADFEHRLEPLIEQPAPDEPDTLPNPHRFNTTREEIEDLLVPMISEGKEPIGSMGDTARPAIFSDQPRSFFDYFYQNFAQVTNPPLDYIREKMVTDLSTYLGKRPNIFSPKELLPLFPGFETESPLLSLGQMKTLRMINDSPSRIKTAEFEMLFDREHGEVGFRSAIRKITNEAIEQVKRGVTILIISDRNADSERLPIPGLLMLRALVNALNDSGLRLNASIVVDSAEVKNTHHFATLIGFGATAVCPYYALSFARYGDHRKLNKTGLTPDQHEKNLIKAFNTGLLKIMAKSGISVARSYQSSKLFTSLGIGKEIKDLFFPGLFSPMGGIGISELVNQILKRAAEADELSPDDKPVHTYQLREHNRGKKGEKHAMTNTRSKIVHDLVKTSGFNLDEIELYGEYLKLSEESEPVNLRHLFTFRKSDEPLPADRVEDRSEILKRFGSGAMSFGAISAESQRDIFLAMKEIGGRSNSGEGGENPYFYTLGISASVKQVASGRFGVNAEYLAAGNEIQIKIAQGAKPGEGGQLMGVKVSEDIAFARNSEPGIDLISPPPLHDIYSIEDLKQLIYELKQIKPGMKVNVKLVSGENIGTIAAGVAKAGADVIHISGGDGGTGAATITSMKHAGLPWEIGLLEVHRTLCEHGLREYVELRTDGGLSAGSDIVAAAMMGAEGFDFGKLLLIAEGCVMARICEKNTCPRGIATHNPKFKKKYRGKTEDVVRMMEILAEDVRRILAEVGAESLDEVIGRTDLLRVCEKHEELVEERGIDLTWFSGESFAIRNQKRNPFHEGISLFNQELVKFTADAIESEGTVSGEFEITTEERAVMATISGRIAQKVSGKRLAEIHEKGESISEHKFDGELNLRFNGSAGQGFGVFMTEGIECRLTGEANDSVGKAMSGGLMVINPPGNVTYEPSENAIIGNCALYGATGGTMFVHGQAGDRFAVRNSGATAVVEGTGLHACEYMTNGTVAILGPVSRNVGAGMTGGVLYLREEEVHQINDEYITPVKMDDKSADELHKLLKEYHAETGSNRASAILDKWEKEKTRFVKLMPVSVLNKKQLNEEISKVKAVG
ncbi:MAG: glutamate synthase large subunit [Balneolaceae bacterium]|nr:glutamate synthase large subunit [Balneolaceae bacterium]